MPSKVPLEITLGDVFAFLDKLLERQREAPRRGATDLGAPPATAARTSDLREAILVGGARGTSGPKTPRSGDTLERGIVWNSLEVYARGSDSGRPPIVCQDRKVLPHSVSAFGRHPGGVWIDEGPFGKEWSAAGGGRDDANLALASHRFQAPSV